MNLDLPKRFNECLATAFDGHSLIKTGQQHEDDRVISHVPITQSEGRGYGGTRQ